MSPTVFRERGFRFHFFSREEPRMHVHIACGNGEAKFWLDPQIELAKNIGLSRTQLREIESILEAQHENLCRAWRDHFGR